MQPIYMEPKSDTPASATPVGSQTESSPATTQSQGCVLVALTLCIIY